jgi:hypothetical protein
MKVIYHYTQFNKIGEGKMINEPVETVEYKGYKINIYPDDNAISPEDNRDDGVFLVGYHSYFTVKGRILIPENQREISDHKSYCLECGQRNFRSIKETGNVCGKCGKTTRVDKVFYKKNYRDRISQDLAQCIARNGKYEDNSINDEAKQYIKDYYIFGLNAYIHSGVSLSLGFHMKPKNAKDYSYSDWDTSNLGLVFVSKKEVKTKNQAEKLAQGLIDEWNAYLSGSIYGYTIKKIDDIEGKGETGGCWGFVGYDNEKSGLLESAKGEIDFEVKQDKEKNKIAISSMA